MDLTNFNAKHAHVKDKCSKPKGSDQKIPNHALFACVLFQMIPIFIS